MWYRRTNVAESLELSRYVTPRIVAACEAVWCCSRSRIGASATHGPHQEANTFRTTTLPRRPARLVVPGFWRFGSAVVRLGASGYDPRATAASIEELFFWLETPNASRASSPTTTATTIPGIKKRRTADEG